MSICIWLREWSEGTIVSCNTVKSTRDNSFVVTNWHFPFCGMSAMSVHCIAVILNTREKCNISAL